MSKKRDEELGMTPAKSLETWRFMRAVEQLGCVVIDPEELEKFYATEDVWGITRLPLEKSHA